jgi:hypothetical protein
MAWPRVERGYSHLIPSESPNGMWERAGLPGLCLHIQNPDTRQFFRAPEQGKKIKG